MRSACKLIVPAVLCLPCDAGCTGQLGVAPQVVRRPEVQLGPRTTHQPAPQAGAIEQDAEGDAVAVNISPAVAISGGTALLSMWVLVALLGKLWRYRRALGVVIRGIELTGDRQVKATVARLSREQALGDFVHRKVKRATRR